MTFVEHDGGRAAAGYAGKTGDCVPRAIAIATGVPYDTVYRALRDLMPTGKSPRGGTPRRAYDAYLRLLGWEWTPTMRVGQGCKVHLRADELPSGSLVVRVTKHMCAVIDGVIYDTHDCSRGGTRCVYGYWTGERAA